MEPVTTRVRARCRGASPLPGKLEPWQIQLLEEPDRLSALLDAHGSPVNLIEPTAMGRNAAGLSEAAAGFGVDLGIYFARKSNKSLGLVDEAWRLGLGVDLASERELTQALARGVPGESLMMTAAVKPPGLLEACIASGATVAIDNADELDLLAAIAGDDGDGCPVALRLAPDLGPDRLPTRFGFGLGEALAIVDRNWAAGREHALTLAGVHFHLDGYSADDRVVALAQAIELVDALRERGHAPRFIDIGGGIPMSYLESEGDWLEFWRRHEDGLLGRGDPLTFDGHELGAVYPYFQEPVRGEWLRSVLGGELPSGGTVAEALRDRSLLLRCEPGRSLLDGCGMTAARVRHRKQRADGTWLIGVEMNRTQCRSTSDDFMVDPLLVRPAGSGGTSSTGPVEGYLVGAYCIERELLTWRRLSFPDGVEVGDIVVFPNTAGYLMHILESASHQIPLAKNLLVGADTDAEPELDAIDVG